MKSYKEVAESVFERRDKYLAEKMRKRAVIRQRAVIALSFCIVVLAGLGIWNNDKIREAFEAYKHGGEGEVIIDVTEQTTTEKVATPTESYTATTEFSITSPPETTAVSQSGTSEYKTLNTSASETVVPVTTTAVFTTEIEPAVQVFQTVPRTTAQTGNITHTTVASEETGFTETSSVYIEIIQTTSKTINTSLATFPTRTTTKPPFTYTTTTTRLSRTSTTPPLIYTTTATTDNSVLWTTTATTNTDYPLWTATATTTTDYSLWTTITATNTDYPLWTTTTATTTNYPLWNTITATNTDYPLWTTTTDYPLWTTTTVAWIDEYIPTTAFSDVEYYLTTTAIYYDNYIF